MKKSSMFGAVALSAVMAMGAVPAFAAPTPTAPTKGDSAAAVGNPDNADDNGMVQFQRPGNDGSADPSADTMVNVMYQETVIQATVPLQITIVATGTPTQAGEIIAPTNYRIENHSTGAGLRVKSVASALSTDSDVQSGWDIAQVVPTTVQSTPNAGKNLLDLTLTPTKAVTEGVSGYEVELNGESKRFDTVDEYWKMSAMKEAGTVDAGARLDLDLAGNSLPNSTDLTEVSNVFTITYTVESA